MNYMDCPVLINRKILNIVEGQQAHLDIREIFILRSQIPLLARSGQFWGQVLDKRYVFGKKTADDVLVSGLESIIDESHSFIAHVCCMWQNQHSKACSQQCWSWFVMWPWLYSNDRLPNRKDWDSTHILQTAEKEKVCYHSCFTVGRKILKLRLDSNLTGGQEGEAEREGERKEEKGGRAQETRKNWKLQQKHKRRLRLLLLVQPLSLNSKQLSLPN